MDVFVPGLHEWLLKAPAISQNSSLLHYRPSAVVIYARVLVCAKLKALNAEELDSSALSAGVSAPDD